MKSLIQLALIAVVTSALLAPDTAEARSKQRRNSRSSSKSSKESLGKPFDAVAGDTLVVLKKLESVNITWKQMLITYSKSFERWVAMTKDGQNVLVFRQKGWGKSLYPGGTVTIRKDTRYVGEPYEPVALILLDPANYIFQKRFREAFPQTWGEWLKNQFSVKDAQKMFKSALNARKAGKKAAVAAVQKMFGKKMGAIMRGATEAFDPAAYFDSWVGTYLYKKWRTPEQMDLAKRLAAAAVAHGTYWRSIWTFKQATSDAAFDHKTDMQFLAEHPKFKHAVMPVPGATGMFRKQRIGSKMFPATLRNYADTKTAYLSFDPRAMGYLLLCRGGPVGKRVAQYRNTRKRKVFDIFKMRDICRWEIMLGTRMRIVGPKSTSAEITRGYVLRAPGTNQCLTFINNRWGVLAECQMPPDRSGVWKNQYFYMYQDRVSAAKPGVASLRAAYKKLRADRDAARKAKKKRMQAQKAGR